MNFYQKFVALCSQKGLSPSKAAEEIGISKSTVSSWKSGGYTPRGKTLNKIARYFGVSADELIGISGWFTDCGNAIREERKEQGETLKRLADNLQISEKKLNKYELNEEPIPDTIFEKAAQYLGFSGPALLNKYNLYGDIPEQFNGDADAYEAFLAAERQDHEDEQAERYEIGFDDFTYAMYNESQELTEENKRKLLEMARFFKEQQDKEKSKK
jgi:repressor LexA